MKTSILFSMPFSLFAAAIFSQNYTPAASARPIEINVEQLTKRLQNAPGVFEKSAAPSAPTIEMPLPDGKIKTFRMFKTQPMHPDLAAQFPEIQTWHGKSVDDGISAVAITISPATGGLTAMIEDEHFQRSFIEPVQGKLGGNLKLPPNLGNLDAPASASYVAWFDKEPEFKCQHSVTVSDKGQLPPTAAPPYLPDKSGQAIPHTSSLEKMMTNNPLALGDKLRTHRLAWAATTAFSAANGNTQASVMAKIVAMVNQINLLYIQEFAIDFQLVANNNLLIFIGGANQNGYPDPYVDNGEPDPDLNHNNVVCNAIIGSANYDIGHLFQQAVGCGGCGGWAGPGPCAGGKASGMSVNSFAVVRHEMGHQFACPHTVGSSGNHYVHWAQGNSIMGGNGPGTLFHITSANIVADWVEAPNYCVPGTNTNNSIPMVTTGAGGMSIPKSTPFVLSGSATDPDPNTTLLYNWAQYNNEMSYSVVNNRIIPAGNSPVFRDFNPGPTGNVRSIPRLEDLVSNTYPFGLFNQNNSGIDDTLNWETLPNYARSLTFRLVAKDYELTGGAYDYGELTFSVDGASGPFVVTSPNTGNPTWTAGNNVTVTWNVANTNNAPVSCANVHIKLSIDGGYTYPFTLATNTPNDGTQTIALPATIPANTTARVRVESATYDNVVFFDISNQNFTINSACVAYAGFISPTTSVTAPQGSANLDLALAPVYGNGSGSANYNVPGTGTPATFALFNEAQTMCVQGCCELNYNTYQFQVDKAGTYSFGVTTTGGGLVFMSVHSTAYNPASICTGFLTSYLREDAGGVGNTNPFEASLTPGVTYTMVFHPFFQNTVSGTVSFFNSVSGTAIVLNQGQAAPPASDYAYTYVAVNQATGLIDAVSQQADFTGLAAGTYRVFGLSYKSANPPPAIANPVTFIGMSMAAALASNCIAFSANYASVTITGGGGCTPPTVTAPTLTQPTCGVPSGTIVVNASGSGTREYSVNNGSTWQTSATFSGLAAGSYNIKVRLQANPSCMTTYSGNPVTLNAPPAPPTVNAPTVTQPPSCAVPTGSIVVNASGSGDLEYSKDNGSNWQLSATFSSLVAGSYHLKVRLKLNPTCVTAYSGNPVVINPAPTAPTVTAPTLTQPTCATPTGTIVVNASGSGTLNYSIDNGATWQASATFSGLDPGNYNIKVREEALPDCVSAYGGNPVSINTAPGAPVVNAPTVTQPDCYDPLGAIVVNASGGTLEFSIDNGNAWQSSATFEALDIGSYFIKVRLQANPACMTEYAANPVLLNENDAPTYSYPCFDGDYIEDFTFDTFSNLGTGCGNSGVSNYSSYLPTGPSVAAGQIYTVNVKSSPTYGEHHAVFIDLNQDGSFTGVGEFFPIGFAAAGATVTADVTIPLSAFTGTSVLRVRCSYDAPLVAADGCFTNLTWGEIEDYHIFITNTTCPNPTYSEGCSVDFIDDFTFGAFSNIGTGCPLTGLPTNLSSYLGTGPTATLSVTYPVTVRVGPEAGGEWVGVYVDWNQDLDYLDAGEFYNLGHANANSTVTTNITVPANAAPGVSTIRARCVFAFELTAADACGTQYGYGETEDYNIYICSPPVVSAPTVTQPSDCFTPTGTIVVNATGSGLEFSIDNGVNWQTSNTFSGVAIGVYFIKVRRVALPLCVTNYAGNPVFINPPTGMPTLLSVNHAFPNCNASNGNITVNASGTGTLQYSINPDTSVGGASWQTGSTFVGLTEGSYNVQVRLQSNPLCVVTYSGNPIVLNCCALPTYANDCTTGDFIQDFTFGAYSNLGTGCSNPGTSNYVQYLGVGPTVQVSETYNVTLKSGPDWDQWYAVYIDFNNNGSFTDPGEFFPIGQAAANSTVSANVTIPANATTGARGMRVRSQYSAPLSAADGCQTNLDYGEIEDYAIFIFCPNNLTVNAVPIDPGSHVADQEISSAGLVGGNSSVTFQAGTGVLLQGGFEVLAGSVLTVTMLSCFP